MDEDDKYWSNLEKIYVHNVYENISSKYDEFFKQGQERFLSKQNRNKSSSNLIYNNSSSDLDALIKPNKCALKCSKFKLKKQIENHNNNNQQKHNEWPKVRQFLLQIEPYSLIGT